MLCYPKVYQNILTLYSTTSIHPAYLSEIMFIPVVLLAECNHEPQGGSQCGRSGKQIYRLGDHHLHIVPCRWTSDRCNTIIIRSSAKLMLTSSAYITFKVSQSVHHLFLYQLEGSWTGFQILCSKTTVFILYGLYGKHVAASKKLSPYSRSFEV